MPPKKMPFLPRFVQAILEGRKTMTARTKRYGKPGDRFDIGREAEIELYAVEPFRLDYIAENFWQEEGCRSREEFIEVWNRLHPKVGYQPVLVVWLHRFRNVGNVT